MKRIITIALSGVLCTGTVASVAMQPVYAYEEQVSDTQKKIYNSFELKLDTNYDAYVKAVNDEHYFDNKKSDNPLYDLLKEQIIKIAKGEGELTFTFDISFTLTEDEIKEVLDQLVKDMEPYFYWSNGKGTYSYIENKDTSKNSITFTFETPKPLFVNEEGIYSDGSGNQLIPWEKVEEKNLTLEDLYNICGDSLVIVMDSDNKHILFVGGNFSDQTVTNSEEALKAIECMKDLMGISDKTTFGLSRTTTDFNGTTYYSFNALQEGGLNKHKVVVVGVDADGKVSCVTNPSQDVWAEADLNSSTAEEYAQVISLIEQQNNITYLEKYGIQKVFYEPLNQYCYVIVGQKNDTGTYVKLYYPTIDCLDIMNTSAVEFYDTVEHLEDEEEQPYEFYFEDVTTTTMKFKDAFDNVVELPVAKDENGYYLVDTDRNIIGTVVHGTDATVKDSDLLKPYYFQDSTEVSPYFVSAFLNMSNVFDLYEDLGLFTTELPIVLNFNIDDPQNNANAKIYSNSIYINVYNSKIAAGYDVVAHELTHAIQMITSNETSYSNANGALMESYADICGNILEMISADEGLLADNVKTKVDEEYWAIGETVDMTQRYMGYPEAISNASKVYGQYFIYPILNPDITSDYGGVHTNSGILNRIAYGMNKEAGLTNKQVLTLFYLSEYLFNVQSDYKDVCAYVEYYMHQLDYTTEQIDAVKKVFDEAYVNEYSDDKAWYNVVPKEGTHRVTFTVLNESDSTPIDYQYKLNYIFNNCALPITKYDDKYGIIVSDNTNLSSIYVNINKNAILVPFNLSEDNVITEDKDITINANDIVSNLYSTYTWNNATDLSEGVAQAYSDTMKKIVVKVAADQTSDTLYVTNNNEGTDAVSTYFGAKYNEELQGYDVLVEKNGTYDFQLKEEDGTKINYDEISVANTDVIDLTTYTPTSTVAPATDTTQTSEGTQVTTDTPATTSVVEE